MSDEINGILRQFAEVADMATRGHKLYMISVVSEMLGIHPQTLRIYEREGFIKPKRSGGNTRLYSEEDVERLEMVLRLTRELGVNLAGVEVILHMRDRMERMQDEIQRLIEYFGEEVAPSVMFEAIKEIRRIRKDLGVEVKITWQCEWIMRCDTD